MNNKILIGSIVSITILLGVTFSSVVGVQDNEFNSEKSIIYSDTNHSIGYYYEYRGFVIVIGISDNISSNNSIVDIIVNNGRLVIFLIGYQWVLHFEWVPFIGFLENVKVVKIYNFKGFIINKFILGLGRIKSYIP